MYLVQGGIGIWFWDWPDLELTKWNWPNEAINWCCVDYCVFSLIQFELLYIEVLYTIKHKIGATAGSHLPFIQDLYAYVQDAFQLTPDEHARLLGKASEEKVSFTHTHGHRLLS